MQMDFSWTAAARQYEQLYQAACRRARQAHVETVPESMLPASAEP
jgi:hypothetical protein